MRETLAGRWTQWRAGCLLGTLAWLCSAQVSLATFASWGDNTYGQTVTNYSSGTNVLGAKTLAAGYWHNLAVTASGNVLAWGLNDYGQTNVPGGLSVVRAVAGGHDHSLALRTNGTVVAWGDNSLGQTNVPADLTNAIAIAAGAFHSAALRADGTVTCWGYDFYGQTDVPIGLNNAVAIACGNAFSLALTSDGRVVGWGDDFYGQTDIPPDLTNAVAISAGGFHGLAARAAGSVRSWGYDDYGQAEAPADLTNAVAVAAGYYHSLALRSDGRIQQWGDTGLGQASPPTIAAPVLGLSAGYAHSLALLDDRPWLLSQPQDVITNSGKIAKFTLTAAGGLPLSARWWKSTATTNTFVSNGTTTGPTNGVMTFTLSSAVFSNVSYFAIVSNTVGSVTSRLASGTILVSPSITNQPQNVITNAGATVLFAVGASGSLLSYQWQFNGANLPGASTNPLQLDSVTTNNTGNYRVIITNALGSVTSQVATLTVGGSPAILTQPQSQSVIQGNDAPLSVVADGTAPLAYQWWLNAASLPDATNSSYTVAHAQPADAGNYSVVLTNLYGSVTSSPALLTVLVPPAINSQPQSVSTNSGNTVRFSVTVTGTPPLTNRWWRFDGVTNIAVGSAVSSNTSPVTFTLTLSNVSTNNAGSYFASVSNSVGWATSSSATLSILTPPAIVSQPQSVITNAGATVTFVVGATGSAPLSYQWSFNGASLDGATSSALEVDNVSTNNAGNYQVAVANPVGSVTSQVATLTLAGYPAILSQPQSQAVFQGSNATLSVVADGAEPLSYQWRFNGTNALADATNSAYTVSGALPGDAGTYSVVITNLLGSVTSSPAGLVVLTPPVILAQPQNVVSNAGQTVRFSITVTGATPLTNRWWRIINGINATVGPLSTTNVSPATFTLVLGNVSTNSAGSYFAAITNKVGLATSSLATLTILAPPVITSQPQNVITNPGATIVFTVSATGTEPLSYQWQFNGTNLDGAVDNTLELDHVTSTNTGNYRVILSNAVGTVTSQPATLLVGYQSLTPAQLWLLSHGARGDALLIALEAGKNYRVQSSTNLQDWVDVTNFLSSSAYMQFTNALATNVNQIFYRVASP